VIRVRKSFFMMCGVNAQFYLIGTKPTWATIF